MPNNSPGKKKIRYKPDISADAHKFGDGVKLAIEEEEEEKENFHFSLPLVKPFSHCLLALLCRVRDFSLKGPTQDDLASSVAA